MAYIGKYRNPIYGFAFVIPSGRKAFWNSGGCAQSDEGCICMQDHGRVVALDKGAYIAASAGYVMEPDETDADREKSAVKFISERQNVKEVEVVRSSSDRLGSTTARRFLVRFTEQGRPMLEEHIIALYKDVVYSLTLRTPKGNYDTNKLNLERVKATWQFIRRTE